MIGTGKRNLQLDVLRGVAILLVLGRHLQLPRPAGVPGAHPQGG
jgi:peptidoglycan/LPS O-acetylase OafA/YrhL